MISRFYYFAQSIVNGQNLPKAELTKSSVATILNWFFVLAAVISFLVIVIAGFRFIISSGEPEKIATARRTIIYAAVGLIVSLSATAIVGFIAGSIN